MKTPFLLTSFLTLSGFVSAQMNPSFGIKAGVVSSTIKGDATKSLEGLLNFTNGMITSSNRTSYYGGIYATIPISNAVSLEPSLNYAQKGYQLNGALNVKGAEFLGINATADLDFQYIEMPVVLNANLSGLHFFAGPQISYLIKSNLKTSTGALGFNVINSQLEATQQFNRWETSLTGGVGVQLNKKMNIIASYDHGLTKIDANKNLDAYNRAYKIGLSMKL